MVDFSDNQASDLLNEWQVNYPDQERLPGAKPEFPYNQLSPEEQSKARNLMWTVLQNGELGNKVEVIFPTELSPSQLAAIDYIQSHLSPPLRKSAKDTTIARYLLMPEVNDSFGKNNDLRKNWRGEQKTRFGQLFEDTFNSHVFRDSAVALVTHFLLDLRDAFKKEESLEIRSIFGDIEATIKGLSDELKRIKESGDSNSDKERNRRKVINGFRFDMRSLLQQLGEMIEDN